MSQRPSRPTALIWATRGRNWGFRFLLTAGLDDPLPTYEHAFAGLSDSPTAWRPDGATIAVRFPDPLDRRDSASRVIPHEFVAIGDLATTVSCVEEGIQRLWPLVDRAYARVWDQEAAPLTEDLVFGA